MRPTLTFVATLCFVTASFVSAPASTPTISQLFVFACNADFSSCPDGMDPTLAPIQLGDGNFYGVTWWAGQNNANAGGTVWRVTPTGQASVVRTFKPGLNGLFLKGEQPVIGFAQGADRNLYGITESGGTTNQGVMYRLTTAKIFKVLHNFCTQSCTDIPGPIILGQDGNFYGVQCEGGAIFQMTPAGQITILHTFSDLQLVYGNLVGASDGNFYGAVEYGGQTNIFLMTPTGSVTLIYQLQSGEGAAVVSLLQASDGNLWGLTTDGGPQPARPGAVFAVTLQGVSVTSAAFNCATTGCSPSGMIQGTDGALYGIGGVGGNAPGANAMGTLFKIEAGLPPKP